MNLIYKYIYSDTGRALSDALDHPEDWDMRDSTAFTIKHIPSDIVFWTGNGGFFFTGYKCLSNFGKSVPIPYLGLIERHFLYRKCAKITKQIIKDKEIAENAGSVELLRKRSS